MEVSSEVRSRVVPIRFTPTEFLRLQEVSSNVQISVSECVRRAAFGRKLPPPPVPSINREAYVELSRIGNNLNQMVKRIHTGEVKIVNLPLVYQLQEEVKKVGLLFLGAEKA